MNISFTLAVRNGLDMTKKSYSYIRQIYPNSPFSISSGGSTDGTKEWLESLDDPNLIFSHTDEDICFSENYNKAIFQAKTDKVVLIHNDMIPGKGFLEELETQLTPDNIVTYTTIEPPIFPGHDRPGKLIRDFGRSYLDFDKKSFDQEVNLIQSQPNEIVEGAAFFMSGYVSSFKEIGGFDEKHFKPVFCEDDDILIRFKLIGKDLITSKHALVYHLVSQTIRFSDDFKDKTNPIEQASNVNFCRKWNTYVGVVRSLEYWRKAINLKFYDISYELKNSTPELIKLIEPFSTYLYIDNQVEDSFIEQIQKTSTYDINSKIKPIQEKYSDSVVVYIDGLNFNQEIYKTINNIPLYLNQDIQVGSYNINNLVVTINNLTEKKYNE